MIASMWAEFMAVFRIISLEQLIKGELREAERSLLKAYTLHEHSSAGITYEQTRVRRLKAALRDLNKQGEMK